MDVEEIEFTYPNCEQEHLDQIAEYLHEHKSHLKEIAEGLELD
jgi:hypothetical protein